MSNDSGAPVGDADLLRTILDELSTVQDLALDHARAWGAWRARRDDVASPPPAAGLALQQRTVELTRWAPALGRLVTVHRGAEGQTWEENFYDDFLAVSGRTPKEIAATANYWHHRLHKLASLIPSQSVASRQSTPRGTGRVTWQEAAERLKCLQAQGQAFTSQQELALDFDCSPSTINKAIHNTPALHAWARVQTVRRPRTQSLDEVVLDSTAQARELDPTLEAAIRDYAARFDPERRALFRALPVEVQLEILNDPDKHQNILGPKP
jgi:hypothetical protein